MKKLYIIFIILTFCAGMSCKKNVLPEQKQNNTAQTTGSDDNSEPNNGNEGGNEDNTNPNNGNEGGNEDNTDPNSGNGTEMENSTNFSEFNIGLISHNAVSISIKYNGTSAKEKYFLVSEHADFQEGGSTHKVEADDNGLYFKAGFSGGYKYNTTYYAKGCAVLEDGSKEYSAVKEFKTYEEPNVEKLKMAIKENSVLINAGESFKIGVPNDADQTLYDNDVKPATEITFKKGYYICKTEFTYWELLTLLNAKVINKYQPSNESLVEKTYDLINGEVYILKDAKYKDYPVSFVRHDEAWYICNSLGGRLPSESEWEYAATGGNKRSSKLLKYAGSDDKDEVYAKEYSPVKTKKPNELGIYDMSGNVWEFCEDDYFGPGLPNTTDFYKEFGYKDFPTDGSAVKNTNTKVAYKVLRGCSYIQYGNSGSDYVPVVRYRHLVDWKSSLKSTGFRIVFDAE